MAFSNPHDVVDVAPVLSHNGGVFRSLDSGRRGWEGAENGLAKDDPGRI